MQPDAFLAALISQIYVLPLVYGTSMSSIPADRCANNIRGLRRAVWINHTAATSWLRQAALHRKEIHAYTTNHMPPAKWRVTFEIWAFRFATFTGEIRRARERWTSGRVFHSPNKIFLHLKKIARAIYTNKNSVAAWYLDKNITIRNDDFLF